MANRSHVIRVLTQMALKKMKRTTFKEENDIEYRLNLNADPDSYF